MNNSRLFVCKLTLMHMLLRSINKVCKHMYCTHSRMTLAVEELEIVCFTVFKVVQVV